MADRVAGLGGALVGGGGTPPTWLTESSGEMSSGLADAKIETPDTVVVEALLAATLPVWLTTDCPAK